MGRPLTVVRSIRDPSHPPPGGGHARYLVAAMKTTCTPCFAIALVMFALVPPGNAEMVDAYPVQGGASRIEIDYDGEVETLVHRELSTGARVPFHRLESYPLQSPIVESPNRQLIALLTGSRSVGTWPVVFRFKDGKYHEIGAFDESSGLFPHFDKAEQLGLTAAAEGAEVDHIFGRIARWDDRNRLVLRVTGDGGMKDFGVVFDPGPGRFSYLPESELPARDIAGYRVISAFAACAGSGTGFLVTDDGHIATCAHVVEGAVRVRVDYGGKAYEARLVALDGERDLCLLQIATGSPTPFLRLAESTATELGQKCFTVGFPQTSILGFSLKFTEGSVSSHRGIGDDPSKFQVSAPVQPGNSGGALVSESGLVLGVIQSKLNAAAVAAVTGDIPQNVNYAVKSDELRELMKKNQLFKPGADAPSLDRSRAIKAAEKVAVRLVTYKSP